MDASCVCSSLPASEGSGVVRFDAPLTALLQPRLDHARTAPIVTGITSLTSTVKR